MRTVAALYSTTITPNNPSEFSEKDDNENHYLHAEHQTNRSDNIQPQHFMKSLLQEQWMIDSFLLCLGKITKRICLTLI